MRPGVREVVVAAAVLAAACGGTAADVESAIVTGADETVADTSDLSTSVAVGTILTTTSDLNLRKGASMNYAVIRVIPSGDRVTVLKANPSGAWYNVSHQGVAGWAHGNYLKVVQNPSAPANTGARSGALSRAAANVGFSYWWGHGRLDESGPTSSTRGSCTGTCPSCSHSGRFGADCSGYVGKIWAVSGANGALDADQHPYSTWNFRNETHGWHRVDRGNIGAADALVYNSGGSGHIVLYERGDAWGNFWAYEAKGCSYGIVHNLRSASSSWVSIARDGY